jgi:hypothetical protein
VRFQPIRQTAFVGNGSFARREFHLFIDRVAVLRARRRDETNDNYKTKYYFRQSAFLFFHNPSITSSK